MKTLQNLIDIGAIEGIGKHTLGFDFTKVFDIEKLGDIIGKTMNYTCYCKPDIECEGCKEAGRIAQAINDNANELVKDK